MKMQDVKMTDEFARHESETQEIAGHEKEGQCWMHSVYSLLHSQSYCVGSNEKAVLYCPIVATATAVPSARKNAPGLLLQLRK